MTPNEVIAKVKNLPAVSQAALKLVSLLDEPAVSNEDIVTVLKYDNVLTAKLLRACNSPYFGFEEQIFSVEQAVLILGHQQILHMVLSLAFGGAMSVSLPGYAIEARQLWTHSLTSAVASEILVKDNLPIEVDPPVAFTAGLLHDMGKLVLNQVLDAERRSAIHLCVAQQHLPSDRAEKEILGTDHCEVGARLLETWRLPAEIVEAVANHHHPVSAPLPRLSAVVHVADGMVHLLDSNLGWLCYTGTADEQANQALGITAEKFEAMKLHIHSSADQVEQFMQLA